MIKWFGFFRRLCVELSIQRFCCLLLVLLPQGFSHADTDVMVNPSAGAKPNVSEPNCAVCHGSNWQGNSILASPNLYILPDWYISGQIQSYQKGWRQRAEQPSISDDMASVARALNATQIADALSVKQQLKPVASVVKKSTLVAERINQGKAAFAACASCHGSEGQGKQILHAPPLAGQNLAYLKAQLVSFGLGRRGFSADDIYGQQMAQALTWPMSDETLDALLAYISTL